MIQLDHLLFKSKRFYLDQFKNVVHDLAFLNQLKNNLVENIDSLQLNKLLNQKAFAIIN